MHTTWSYYKFKDVIHLPIPFHRIRYYKGANIYIYHIITIIIYSLISATAGYRPLSVRVLRREVTGSRVQLLRWLWCEPFYYRTEYRCEIRGPYLLCFVWSVRGCNLNLFPYSLPSLYLIPFTGRFILIAPTGARSPLENLSFPVIASSNNIPCTLFLKLITLRTMSLT